MTAQDYPVSFGYGESDGEFYTKSRPHRGNDRPTPNGTSIRIGETIIGLTGATGLVSGPHLHTQAGTDEWCQNTVDPTNHEFKHGVVVHTGTADQWGNYVIILTEDTNTYVCYAHLSRIYVEEDYVIPRKEEHMRITDEQIRWHYRTIMGVEPSKQEVANYHDQDFYYVTEDIKRWASNNGQDATAWRNRALAAEAKLKSSGDKTTVLKPGNYEVI